MVRRKSYIDRMFDIFNFLIMMLVVIAVLYPFINATAISLNDANDTVRGGITFYPRQFTLRNYELIISNPRVFNAYTVTIMRTVIGTVLGLLFTTMFAYGMANPNLIGKRFYVMFSIIPMYFTGGLIPFFLLVRSLGLMNNFWVYIIPGLIGIWNMILMRTYFKGIPLSLEESARIDGANYFTVLYRIIVPISAPIVATIALFIGVGHWNAWFDAAIFITDQDLKPMQNVLLSIISEAAFAEQLASSMAAAGGALSVGDIGRGVAVNVRSITLATMIVTIIPIVLIYPFLQRYFIKGIMIGSLKG